MMYKTMKRSIWGWRKWKWFPRGTWSTFKMQLCALGSFAAALLPCRMDTPCCLAGSPENWEPSTWCWLSAAWILILKQASGGPGAWVSLFVSSFGSANFAVSFCFALQASPSLPVSIFSTRRDKASDLDLGDRCANERFVPDKTQRLARGENSMCLSHWCHICLICSSGWQG